MAGYLVLPRDFDFDHMAALAADDQGPVHVLGAVRDRLAAEVVSPGSVDRPGWPARLAFRLLSHIYSTPTVWHVANQVARTARDGELVYATGEDLGLAICVLTRLRRRTPALAISVVWPGHVRQTKLLLRSKSRIQVLFAANEDDARAIRAMAGPNGPPVELIPAMVDSSFFSPATEPPARERPLLASAGLVDRDYVSLAAAVDGLPVDVEVCAVSSMPSGMSSPAYPASLPPNMHIGQQSLRELRDMYREASLTVIPLVTTSLGAGLTVAWEAMACGCPVIASPMRGDLARFVEEGLVIGVPPEDPLALRQAIEAALAEPDRVRAMTERARAHIVEHLDAEHYVETVTSMLVNAERRAAGNRSAQ